MNTQFVVTKKLFNSFKTFAHKKDAKYTNIEILVNMNFKKSLLAWTDVTTVYPGRKHGISIVTSCHTIYC